MDRSAADTVVQVQVGIDNKNPMAAYCSTDRIVIGSAWIREHPDHGAFVFAHELAHFIMGDVNVMIHNIKVKEEREAILGALRGAVVGAATGLVDNVISGHKGEAATANIQSQVLQGITWGRSMVPVLGHTWGAFFIRTKWKPMRIRSRSTFLRGRVTIWKRSEPSGKSTRQLSVIPVKVLGTRHHKIEILQWLRRSQKYD